MPTDLLEGARWQCCRTEPDAVSDPADLDSVTDWLPVSIPGTAASAWRAAGRSIAGLDFDAGDWWFRTTVLSSPGPYRLQLDGVATVAETWVGGDAVLRGDSMFARQSIDLDLTGDRVEIAIRCRALGPLLAEKRPRPRWRTALVAQQNLRWFRTTLLGRMPGSAGSAQPVGPWRPARLLPVGPVEITSRTVRTRITAAAGVADVMVLVRTEVDPAGAEFTLGGGSAAAVISPAEGGFAVTASLRVDDVELWWPHTHGAQPVYPLTLRIGGLTLDLGAVGFRTIDVDRTGGAFALAVNGVPIFARGACWVPPDPVSLNPSYDELRRALEHYVAAGFNVVRVTGTMVYESSDFWRLCTELGLLVWQDCMFATLDPPADPEFEQTVRRELRGVFGQLQGCPAIGVVSGGSESEQQPAMLGLAPDRRALPLLETTIPELTAELLPGVPCITSSPTGGLPPTRIDTGVSHYFGVGAYLRPLSDARTAGVRFAAECLAFATPPERHSVEEFFGSARPAGHDPRWKAGVPRDNGSSWDFEDVRDHYVHRLFGIDPVTVRRADPDFELDLGRATVAAVVEAVFAEWRRPASTCAGAIVLSMRDLVPGAGWGLIDSTGVPKAPWYAAARVLAPVAVFVTDEGLDGVSIHVANDRGVRLYGHLTAQLFNSGGAPLDQAESPVSVAPHGAETFSLLALLGEFRDLNHAYRFGPAAYDALVVRVEDDDGVVRAEATHLLLGQVRPRVTEIGLTARVDAADGGPVLTVATRDLAQWVSIDCPGYQPADSWFHLAAGAERAIRLMPVGDRDGGDTVAGGSVRAINSVAAATIRRP